MKTSIHFLTSLALGLIVLAFPLRGVCGTLVQADSIASSGYDDDNDSPNTLEKNCREGRSNFACGECETALQNDFNQLLSSIVEPGSLVSSDHWGNAKTAGTAQIRSNESVESFLEKAAAVMKKNNPQGGGKLNFITIGESRSLHTTSPGNPRIALKSPDSELWVTFNTDPATPGYSKVEVMRWDGKQGRFLFQEISFAKEVDSPNGHVNLSPKVCANCHRSPSRPIWETYRAWPGVLPPRDDLVEKHAGKSIPDANGRAYFDFLERVVAAKEMPAPTGTHRRLAILDIPVEGDGTPKAKLNRMKAEVKKQGWSRVRHFPDKEGNKNQDLKTAEKAGPSHLAFDQLMSQQICATASNLKNHPDFEEVKFAIAGIMACEPDSQTELISMERLERYLPEKYLLAAEGYVRATPLIGLDGKEQPVPLGRGGGLKALYDHTVAAHESENDYKRKLHSDFVKSWVTQKEGKPDSVAEAEARYLTTEVKNNPGPPWTVIDDPGGIQGVAESDAGRLALLRYILEPLGINVGAWSMARGSAAVKSPSYSFSDQFSAIFSTEPAIQKVMKDMSGANKTEKCKHIAQMSKSALMNTSIMKAARPPVGPKRIKESASGQKVAD